LSTSVLAWYQRPATSYLQRTVVGCLPLTDTRSLTCVSTTWAVTEFRSDPGTTSTGSPQRKMSTKTTPTTVKTVPTARKGSSSSRNTASSCRAGALRQAALPRSLHRACVGPER
jgi:hypothetical protein